MIRLLKKKEAAKELGLKESDVRFVHKLEKLGYIHFKENGRRKSVDETELPILLREMRDHAKYRIMTDLIFVLWDMFRRERWSFPGTLRGQIGELQTLMRLIEEFDKSKLLYFGGTTPKVDIILDGKKIQVKTQYPDEPAVRGHYAGYGVEAFGSPTIRVGNRRVLDKEDSRNSIDKWDRGEVEREFGFDYLILTIIRKREPEFYVFDISEVRKHFKSFGCWSGKYGDVTISCIEKVLDSQKAEEVLNIYQPHVYHPLFERAKDAWHKIQ